MKRRILLASTNQGKLAELSELIGSINAKIEWAGLKDYPDVPEVLEDGSTFAENACKKALGYAEATGLWTIADDSGLVIDALDGQPGVYSARYAADECHSANRKDIDIANYKKVLTKLNDTPSPGKVLLETEGAVEGVINHAPLGENGFGYDPIFYIPSLNKTAAQLDHQEKNSISHRGNAIRKLKPLLEDLLRVN
ncbi:MAG: non-canonical purine NTP pyrophosphatase [Planctomycetota bacterium]|jgi:XTP/dITP diphosphohydrolase